MAFTTHRYTSTVNHAQNVLDEYDRINGQQISSPSPTAAQQPQQQQQQFYQIPIDREATPKRTTSSITTSQQTFNYQPPTFSNTNTRRDANTKNIFRPQEGDHVRVSSVLFQQESKNGPQNMFDGAPSTSWSSDRGTAQWALLSFTQPVRIHELRVSFKRGLAARTMTLFDIQPNGEQQQKEIEQFWPENCDEEQQFVLSTTGPVKLQHLKLLFSTSYDYNGHIEISKLEIIGERC